MTALASDYGLRTFAACIVAVLVGLYGLFDADAPSNLLVVNALALGLAVPLFFIVRRLDWQPLWLAAPLLALLAATLIVGAEIDGVRRWLALGPVRLHIGMAVVPALAVAMAASTERQALFLVALAAFTAALQPDLATALALFVVSSAIAVSKPREPLRWVALLPTGAALLWCLLHRDGLEPVPFVEGVWGDTAVRSPALFALMLASLLLVLAAPLIGWRRMGAQQRASGAAFSATILGFALASILGAYPVPLFGGGAAPIIGCALASALLSRIDR